MAKVVHSQMLEKAIDTYCTGGCSKTERAIAAGLKGTYYMRDANGQVLAIYEDRPNVTSGEFNIFDTHMYPHLTEWHIYGNSYIARTAIRKPHLNDEIMNVRPRTIDNRETRYVTNKTYEVKDHLGNVRLTFSDLKKTSGTDFFVDLRSLNNYYPYGFEQSERVGSNEEYKYSFNGKEDDTEIGLQDYGFRMYNQKISRFISVDPLKDKFPWRSHYITSDDNPIEFIDDGNQSIRPSHGRYNFNRNNAFGPNSQGNSKPPTKVRQYGSTEVPTRTPMPRPTYVYRDGYDGVFNPDRTTQLPGATDASTLVLQIVIDLGEFKTKKLDIGFKAKTEDGITTFSPISGSDAHILRMEEKKYQNQLQEIVDRNIKEQKLQKDDHGSYNNSELKAIETASQIEMKIKHGPSPMEQFEAHAKKVVNSTKPNYEYTEPTIQQTPYKN